MANKSSRVMVDRLRVYQGIERKYGIPAHVELASERIRIVPRHNTLSEL